MPTRFLPGIRRSVPLLCLVLAGCAGIPDSVRTLPDPGVVLELDDTPFFAQDDYQCGPAALATVLEASGVSVELTDLVDKVYVPGRRGSLQLELLAASRTSGRLPYIVDGTLSALTDEIRAGRPVIVLQNLGVAALPRWHYAVVVGIDGPGDRVILRSGVEQRRLTPINLFLRTWARGGYWALTVLRPGEIPGNVNRERYFSAVVGLEQADRHDDAIAAWRAALGVWPDDPVALFGLGNARLALDDPTAAETAYRRLIASTPHFVLARNNLALALAAQGRIDEAMEEIRTALADQSDPELIDELEDTRNQILNMVQAP